MSFATRNVWLPPSPPRHSTRLTFSVEGIIDDSSSLVPGDVVDVSEASLNTFPADLVLLSGDAIVNESMLTGESVPVSKYPVEDAEIFEISKPGGDVAPELTRHVVFCGTKIIRIRKTSPVNVGGGEPEALAMVMRTGELSSRVRKCCCGADAVFEHRLQHDQGCSRSFDAVSQTIWVRSRLVCRQLALTSPFSDSPFTATRSGSSACSRWSPCAASWPALSTLSSLG